MHHFIHDMILRNSVNAALQRSHVYSDSADAATKRLFKQAAKDWLKSFGERYSRETATEKTWTDAIASLSKTLSKDYSESLASGV